MPLACRCHHHSPTLGGATVHRSPSRRRSRTLVVATMTGSLVAAAAGTASSAQADPGPSSRLEVIQALPNSPVSEATARPLAGTPGPPGPPGPPRRLLRRSRAPSTARRRRRRTAAPGRHRRPTAPGSMPRSPRPWTTATCPGRGFRTRRPTSCSVSGTAAPRRPSPPSAPTRGTTRTRRTTRWAPSPTRCGSPSPGATTSCRSPEEESGWWSMSRRTESGTPTSSSRARTRSGSRTPTDRRSRASPPR